MLDSQNFFSGKRNFLFGLLLLLVVAVLCVAFSIRDEDDFTISRREVLLRRIGHELLLQSGDSSSRVLPIKKMAENEYQISFENELTFFPDSLMQTTRRFLDNTPLSGDYIVTVVNCDDATVTYGYAVSQSKKEDIVSCRGRKQPKDCYLINIKFKPTGITIANKRYLLGGLSFLALVGFVFMKAVRPGKVLPEGQQVDSFTLGSVLFDAVNRKLLVEGKTIDLTGTETRLLHIFATSPNETIARSRLQKEIWEDEGVIVGRSLDMFISKLRKKLESEPNVNIVVIRGKGYKLVVNTREN